MRSVATKRRIGCDASGIPLVGQIDDERRFHITFKAEENDIDELGHVNNAKWIEWIQEASVAHWLAAPRSCDRDGYVAVVVRHEVDYRANIRAGDQADAITWVDGRPRGPRYARRVEFTDTSGRLLVSAFSHWALIEKVTRKLVRVPVEVAAPFLRDEAGMGNHENGRRKADRGV